MEGHTDKPLRHEVHHVHPLHVLLPQHRD